MKMKEMLKQIARPENCPDESAVLNKLIRTGGKKYDDDISIAVSYE